MTKQKQPRKDDHHPGETNSRKDSSLRTVDSNAADSSAEQHKSSSPENDTSGRREKNSNAGARGNNDSL